MRINPLLMSDGYKQGHHAQYPSGTEYVYSNTTPRKSRYTGIDKVVVFGIQYFIRDFLIERFNEDFFEQPLDKVMTSYKMIIDHYLGPNVINEEQVAYLHGLGYLPLHIKALPEGTLCPIGVPLMTIINTDPKCYWLTNFVETISQTMTWGMITSATIAYEYKKIFTKYNNLTSDSNDNVIPWQAHDFSMRGMSSFESSYTSAAAHLLSFCGTDSIPGIVFLEQYYWANCEEELIGGSVSATEHAVMCAGGEENERETVRRLIEDIYPEGIVSIVSDTWDFWKMVTETYPSLKPSIMNRNGKVVVRPDCYDDQTEILTDSGWKFFTNLSENDLVAQVLDDGSREFVKPLEIINQTYSGIMHQFKDFHGKVDLLVTPNHRMVLKQNGKERIVEASDLSRYGHYHQKMIRSASASSNPNIHLSDLERLRIAFQADGSFQTGCNENKIRFSFAKQRKIDRLCYILDNLKFEYKIYDLKDGRHEFNITLPVSDFSKDFEWVNNNTLTKEWCEEFIEECSHWDSCRRSDERFKFDTTILSVANKVEFIALSAGYGALKSTYSDNRSDKFSDLITIHILKDNEVGGQSWENTEVNYTGTVHCVKVPSGKVFVRRNRCTLVSGNSGDPVKIICGYHVNPKKLDRTQSDIAQYGLSQSLHMSYFHDHYDAIQITDGTYYNSNLEKLEPHEVDGAIVCLYKSFGGTINSKGYKELDIHIGLIYGDSITLERAERICQELMIKGYATTNVVYGVGSYTYQYNTRDTFGLACKATWVQINGIAKSIYKDPKTDDGTKKSAKGLLSVMISGDKLILINDCTPAQEKIGELQTVFLNGESVREFSLKEIRQRLSSYVVT